MEMIKSASVFALAWVLSAGSGAAAPADPVCYTGGGDTGWLEFRGAVEGTGFSGRFGRFSVRYCMPETGPVDGRIEVRVELASVDTRNRDRDEALIGPEFFDVERFPIARWTSTRIEAQEAGYRAEGELELKGIRAGQPIRFALDPDGQALIARGAFLLAGDTEIDRQRFAVGTGEFADPEFVRDRIEVQFEVDLARD